MSETMDTRTESPATKRRIVARVVSARMDKSASVEIMRMVRHPLYGKYLRRRTKLLVHDEANACHAGDVVAISSCRPRSRHKAWEVVEILEQAAGGKSRTEPDEMAAAEESAA